MPGGSRSAARLLAARVVAASCALWASSSGPGAAIGQPPRPKMVVVTSLEDNAAGQPLVPGSLRWAIETHRGPVMIRFNVGGNIDLKRGLDIRAPYTAIDGSQAPPPGITLRRWQVTVVNTHDIVLRHLRFRCGDGWPSHEQVVKAHGEGGQRSLLVIGYRPKLTRDVLIENCSIQNSTDDNGNVWGNVRRIEFRYCIFSGGHVEPSKAFLAGDNNDVPVPDYPDWLTIHHCLLTNTHGRAPDIAGGVCHLFNNVISEHIGGSCFTNAKANVVANYLNTKKNHPWSPPDRVLVAHANKVPPASLYVSGNYLDGRLRADRHVFGQANRGEVDLPEGSLRSRPWPGLPPYESAPEALHRVLREAGCTLPIRDEEDRRVIALAARAAGVDLSDGTPTPRD